MASGPETAVRTESNSPPAVPNSWIALGQLITRFQPEKVAPWLGFRNGLGVALSLAIGVVMGNVGSGLVLTTGALNVSFADSQDPYLQRARRMLAASILVGLAVFTGALCANDHVIAVVVVLIGSFAAGMLVAVGTTASDIGTITVVTLAVYAAQPMTPRHALYSGLLAFAGGLFQMFLSLALWKVRRYHPERRVLAELYLDLSRTAALPVEVSQSPPGSAQGIQAQAALAALGTDYSIEGERYRFLLSQAERIRLSLLALAHLRRRLRREDGTSLEIETLDHCFKVTSRMLSSVGTSLFAGEPVDTGAECLLELHSAAEGLRREQPDRPSQVVAMLLDARYQMDALAGQLRSVVDLAASATPAGLEAFERRESRQPLHLRLAGVAATLRANLTLNSAACRHAIRLAICTALGDAIGRAFSWNRTYWIPMTIIIVLKPDFSSTLSRGILRFAGTFAGLLFATGLFHLLSPSRATEIILIGLLMFVLRCYGPANYGIAATAVTALVVLLFAVSGIAPKEVMLSRGLNTIVGGLIALFAYIIWPTWEQSQIPESLALMLDAYRKYFRAVQDSYVKPGDSFPHELDVARSEARLARSNIEASVERLGAEPRFRTNTLSSLAAILASSHRFVHAVMSLEAGLSHSHPVPARDAFRVFAKHTELTLYYLAAALRGSPLTRDDLPDLREDHHALVASGDSLTERYALVNVETDRITNSLNTLTVEILNWLSVRSGK